MIEWDTPGLFTLPNPALPRDDTMPSAKIRCLIALSLFCALYVALAAYSELWLSRETEGRIADDFGIYYQAYLHARAGDNPYLPYKIGLSFIYHPFALTWVSIFDWNSVTLAAILWMAGGALAWIAAVFLTIRTLRLHMTQQQAPSVHGPWIWLAAFLLLAFAPVGETIHVGQINGFVVLCLVLAYYCSERSGAAWEIAAAVAFSLAVLLKTSPIVVTLYFVALRRYRLIIFSIISAAVLSAIAAIQFSPNLLLQFIDTTLRIGSGIHYSFYNHSPLRMAWQFLRFAGIQGVDGMLVRLFQISSGLLFILFSVSGWLTVTERTATRLLLFNLLIGLMVIASPIVWYHHSTLLLFPVLTIILDKSHHVRWLGLAAMLLIQSERALGADVLPAGLVALVGQTVVLLVLIILYGRDRWPALRMRLSQRPALWQRYSGDV